MLIALVNYRFFSLPKDRGTHSWSLRYCPSPPQFDELGVGIPFVTVSPSLLMFSVVSLSFVVQRNCFINRYNLMCSMEEVSSGSSYNAILDQNPYHCVLSFKKSFQTSMGKIIFHCVHEEKLAFLLVSGMAEQCFQMCLCVL